MPGERLVLDDEPGCRCRRNIRPQPQDELEDAELLHPIRGRGQPIEPGERAVPRAHVATTPSRPRRVVRLALQQPGDGRRIAHLHRPAELTGEEAAERPAAAHVCRDERLVAPRAGLIAADEPAAVGGVGLDDPQVGMVIDEVLIGVGAPFLVRAADPVDPQHRPDVGRVVEGLREILEAAPDEHVERACVGPPGGPDDRVGARRRSRHALVRRRVDRPLEGQAAQGVRTRIPARVRLERRVVGGIAIDHLQDVLAPPRPEGR
jgi:hypothetical protein